MRFDVAVGATSSNSWPAMQPVRLVHTRLLVSVGALLWYSLSRHTASDLHTRSVVAEARMEANSVSGSQVVNSLHFRSVDGVAATVCHSFL